MRLIRIFGYMALLVAPWQRETNGPASVLFTCICLRSTGLSISRDLAQGTTIMRVDSHPDDLRLRGIVHCQCGTL